MMKHLIVCAWMGSLAIGCTIDSDPMLEPIDAGVDGGDAGSQPVDAGPFDAGFACSPGEPGCFGNVHFVCGEGDTRTDEIVCPDACDPELGCVTCVPGSRRCDGSVSMVCDLDGSRWLFGRDCDDWGVACGAGGFCDDACATAEATRSYVGCEYWPVPLANHESLELKGYDFRVVVANAGLETAEITVFRGARLETRESVAPGAAIEISLPWIDGESFAFESSNWQGVVTPNGAYRLISSSPVIVSQFNPFHYVLSGQEPSFSNDASLLFPSHVLGTEHFGATYPALWSTNGVESSGWPGYLAVVGVAPETTHVTMEVRGDVAADRGGRWPRTSAGGTIEFDLARGEVAQIVAADPPPCGPDRPGFRPIEPEATTGYCYEESSDLTGSRIVSDRAVAVFGGHTCAFVPIDVPACDHLETALAPVATWGRRFATLPMRDPETTVPSFVRIVSGRDDTTVTLDPPQRDVSTLTLDRGDQVELPIDAALAITADAPIQVAQILVGQNITNPPLERGDPALTMLVPEEQFRFEYVFVTPSSYTPVVNGQSWLLVSREPGVEITLDGAEMVASWTRVGDRELALVPVNGGAHRARSASAFGLIAYGLGLYTSYAYPAGLDLRIVPF